MRNLPQLPENREVSPKVCDDIITQTRRYSLITPLFGGGVEPNNPDPITVVRATSVRGHLRFWWRACRAGQFNGNLREMKAYEDALWGSAAKEGSGGPSQVVVVVKEGEKGKKDRPFEVYDTEKGPRVRSRHKKGSVVHPYAAFPLQPTDKEVKEGGPDMPTKKVRLRVSFSITITFPEEYRKDVEAALWAWETLGGIGARTRRGFGALRLEKVDGQPHTDLPPANPSQAQDWLNSKLREMVETGPFPENVPHLQKLHFKIIQKSNNEAQTVWEALINQLKQFRQRRAKGSNGRPGRSLWPEPSAIRGKTKQSSPKHRHPPIPDPPISKFPRAVFGLPIGFQFKDSSKKDPDDSTFDPRKTSLEFESHDRLASPLILKPLACQGDKAVGLALILHGAGLFYKKDGRLVLREKLKLKAKEQPLIDWPVEVVLNESEAKKIPMLNGETDVLQAFLKYLRGDK